MTTATAQAAPNIAIIKCWGNRDGALRLPMNGSISINLDGLYTRTEVSFQHSLPYDELTINGREVASRLQAISGVKQVLLARAGGAARFVEEEKRKER